jgi:transposase
METVYVGMDVGSKVTAVAARGESGEVVERLTFRTSRESLVESVTKYGEDVRVMFEEGELAGWAYRTLLPHAREVIVCDPKRNAWVAKGKSKSDKVDADKLSELLRINSFATIYHTPHEEMAAFKISVQRYGEATKRAARQMVQVKALFRAQGVFTEGKRVYGAEGRIEYVGRLKDPFMREILIQEYDLLDYLSRKKVQAGSQVMRMSRNFPVIEHFKRIPGVGPVLAARFVAYVLDPNRFSKRGLWKFSCLGIVNRSSDGVSLGKQYLDKAGVSAMKDLSRKAFDGAMRTKKTNGIQIFFKRSYMNCGDYDHARLSTQRKILSMMNAMWRDGTDYSDEMFLGPRA